MRVFPDGEGKITVNSKSKKNTVIVVQSTSPPVDSNFMEIFSLIHKARQWSSNVIAIIPYMGYARQDREFLPGEVITVEIIAKLLQAAGAKKIIVVDIHSTMGLKKFKISAKNVSAVSELAGYFKKIRLKDVLVVSPDLGGAQRAKEFARALKSDHIALKKQRDRRTGKIKIMTPNLHNIADRDIILVDDMISTGGSIIKATGFLKKNKCRRVFVACTHALLVNDAEKKIKRSGVTQIVSTNTISGKTGKVDVSGILAKAVV